ncbi:uncharacterized protein LOC124639903 [Helicoverpa zea]|uniref:uncharacterized protein LOC124639903 n=1 Tax=Helicoverpa zea TaxID=7113 RepID=UPI001F5802DB|nr:uncharacterized protein LOC124639903 [Helicoverpa zea]
MTEIKVNSGRKIVVFLILVICISSCCSIQFRMKDKRLNRKVIKKYSQNSPVIFNIKADKAESFKKLPAKPPPVKRSIPKLVPLNRLPRSIFTVPKLPLVPFFLPLIPRTPLLPLFPNWVPPPTAPTSPILPPVSRLSRLLGWEKHDKIIDKLWELRHNKGMTTAEHLRYKKFLFK